MWVFSEECCNSTSWSHHCVYWSAVLWLSIIAVKVLGLVPSILCYSKPVDLSAFVNQYSSDLPSPELFEMELHRWEGRHTTNERPSSASDECDRDMFPNIMFCRLPVQCQWLLVSMKEVPVGWEDWTLLWEPQLGKIIFQILLFFTFTFVFILIR